MRGPKANESRDESRRNFLRAGVVAAAGAVLTSDWLPAQTQAPRTIANVGELQEIGLDALRRGIDSGKFAAEGLAGDYMSSIQSVDRTGSQLNSVIETLPNFQGAANALDRERKAKGSKGPLHGIPILIKDNIATSDDMQTTAGSLALVGSRPPKDAFLVTRLRAAGALILGKTNCSEWANFRGRHSTSGWSGRGGQTRNPYALDRNPSGSSSGSGAAVAANLCPCAVGTETDGSIVSPSSVNGIVGIKPTVGLVSRSGIIPISHTQDTAGPMARTVADAAALLSVLAGVDPEDPATEAARSHIEADYTRFLDANGLRGSRLGVVRKYAGFNMHVDRVFEEAMAALKSAGAEIIDPVEIPSIDKLDDPETEVLHFEFKTDLNRYLASLGPSAPVHNLEEVITFNQKNRARELPWFGQESMEKAQGKGDLNSPDYQKALADCRRLSRQEGIDAAMEKFRLDALIAPTDGPAWPTDWINGDHFSAGTSTLAAVAGYPHITSADGLHLRPPDRNLILRPRLE